MDAFEQHASQLVSGYAAALGIAAPDVRVVEGNVAPCYQALFNRIEIDRRTLALPEPLLCLVVAHEVGHATQRAALLTDFAWTLFGVAALLAAPCIMFAALPADDLWRVSIPGACFVLVLASSYKAWRAHTARRAMALELDADAKAAQLCGALPALHALEAMATRGPVHAARLEALRDRLRASDNRIG